MRLRDWRVGIVLLICVAAGACVSNPYRPITYAPSTTAVAPPPGSDQPFYEDLAPYGQWAYVEGPGWVWSPYNMQADWRPYQVGHWVFTDYGWTWASDEEFGSVVFHYGRWYQDRSRGWAWVPGTEWGPAWVAWHEGGGYVGWAPLPWQVRVRAGVGLDWAGVDLSIQPSLWCFVSARYLVDPGLRTRIVAPARNTTIIHVTRNVTNYTYIDNRVINQGVRVESIGRAVGHTIPRYRLAEASPSEAPRGGQVRGQEFLVSRPDPSRGSKSQGRALPPGHDPFHRGRRFGQRDAEEATTAPAADDSAPSQPAVTSNEPASPPPPADPAATREHGRGNQHGRGRRIFDDRLGRTPPSRPAPRGTAATPPAAPGQPASGGQPAQQAPAPTQETRGSRQQPPAPQAGSAESGGQHSASQPAARQGHEKPQTGRGRGRGPKDDASKAGGSKADDTKPSSSDSDESKKEQ